MKMVDYRTPRTGFVTNVLFWLALGITLGVVGSTLYVLAMIVAAAIGHPWWG